MTWLPHHTNIKARVIGIQGSTLKQLYNRRLDVDEGRFTYQLMRINTMHLKCAWARQSIGLDQRIDNHVSITITKRNFDNLVIHPWFRYQRTRACWYRAIGCIAQLV